MGLGLTSVASAAYNSYRKLKDGTRVVLKEGQLFIGDSRTPAADGSYELRNGKTVRVQGGLVVGITKTHKPF
jgi:hypothetical protein